MTAANNNARPGIGASSVSGATATTARNDSDLPRQEELRERKILISRSRKLLCGCFCDETVCNEHKQTLQVFFREMRERANRLSTSEHWRWSW
jgi:hypothetical protein